MTQEILTKLLHLNTRACPGQGESEVLLPSDCLNPPPQTDLLCVRQTLAPAKSHLETTFHKTSPIKATATHFDSSQIAFLSFLGPVNGKLVPSKLLGRSQEELSNIVLF